MYRIFSIRIPGVGCLLSETRPAPLQFVGVSESIPAWRRWEGSPVEAGGYRSARRKSGRQSASLLLPEALGPRVVRGLGGVGRGRNQETSPLSVLGCIGGCVLHASLPLLALPCQCPCKEPSHQSRSNSRPRCLPPATATCSPVPSAVLVRTGRVALGSGLGKTEFLHARCLGPVLTTSPQGTPGPFCKPTHPWTAPTCSLGSSNWFYRLRLPGLKLGPREVWKLSEK